jgi:hypothetical protein
MSFLTCPACKYDRVEFLDHFRQWVEDGNYAMFSPHSHFCSFFIQTTLSIDAGEFGAPPAARNAQSFGEASTCLSDRQAVLDIIFPLCGWLA